MEVMTRKEALNKGLKTYFTGKPCPKGHIAKRKVSGACVECQSVGHKLYRESRKEKLNNNSAKWREENKDRQKELTAKWRKSNPEKYKQHAYKWQNKNPDKVKVIKANRRAAKLQAIPPWANMEAIAAIYKEARAKGLTVDHIYPLQGKNTCGLHVENNLQLLTFSANAAKGNRIGDF